MKRRSLILIGLSLIFAIGLTTGCKSKKALTGTQQKRTSVAQSSVDSLIAKQPAFATASAHNAKISLEMQSRKINANADIDIDYDKKIKVTVKVLGIDMVVAEIGQDNIRVIDKLNKRYTEPTYQELQKVTGLPISFKEIQALLCNHIFGIGVEDKKLKTLKPQNSSADGQPSISFSSNGVSHRFSFDTAYHITCTDLNVEGKPYKFKAVYSQFQNDDEVLFPHVIDLSGSTSKKSAKVTVRLPKTDFNAGAFTAPYNVQKLTKVPLEAFLSF